MKRIPAIASIASLSMSILSAAAPLSQAVTITTFDNWAPDSVYGSWPNNGEFSINPTNFGIKATGFGGGYANIGDPFLIDGTGTTTLQLSATVNAGVAGFVVALGDTTGHEWNYAWYGNPAGGGINGTNDYVFTKAISDKSFSTGVAGQLDISKIDYIHIQVDPGAFAGTQYDVTYNDLSLIAGPANLTWNNSGGTGDGATWDLTNQNWNNGVGPASFAPGDNVSFTNANNGHTSVTINGAVNPASTTVNSSSSYVFSGTGGIGGAGGLTVAGTGSLTLNTTANTYGGPTTVASGATLNVNGSLPATALLASGHVVFGANSGSGILARTLGPITLAAGGSVSVASPSSAAKRTVLITSALTFGGTTPALEGVMDLGANDMIVRGGSVTAIRSQLRVGLNGTSGLTSSAAAVPSAAKMGLGYAAITAAGTFDGQPVGAGDVVVKYTLVGDTNLDSTVNFDDLLALAKNYNGSNTTWATGDFTYEGTTDFDDLLALAKNYNRTLAAAQQASLGEAFSADYALAVSLVPEPGLVGAVGLGVLAMVRRRHS